MTKKSIETSLHYAQYIIARIILVGGIGFLIYSIWIQKISAIIFSSIFITYTLILIKKVFDRPTKIEFDENFIYLNNGNERIELENLIGLKKNQILYLTNNTESKLKLPNFYFMDKKWMELKRLIKTKSTKHNTISYEKQ